MARAILLVSANPDDQQFAREVAQTLQLELATEAELSGSRVAAALEQGHEVMMDAGLPGVTSILQTLSVPEFDLRRLHLIAPPTDKPVLAASFESPACRNILFRRFPRLAEDAALYASMIQATSLDSPSGLKSLIGENIEFESVKFTETIEKAFVAHVLAYELAQLKFHELIIPPVTNAVDELLMNAMYDAPVDEKGEQIYAKESRNSNFRLSGRQSVEMQLGAKDNLIAITVIDRFGSVKPATIMKHLAKVYNGNQNEKTGVEMGGAGLGLSLILRSGGSLHFSYKPGERTEVTVFFRRTDKLREFSKQFQFVSTRAYA